MTTQINLILCIFCFLVFWRANTGFLRMARWKQIAKSAFEAVLVIGLVRFIETPSGDILSGSFLWAVEGAVTLFQYLGPVPCCGIKWCLRSEAHRIVQLAYAVTFVITISLIFGVILLTFAIMFRYFLGFISEGAIEWSQSDLIGCLMGVLWLIVMCPQLKGVRTAT